MKHTPCRSDSKVICVPIIGLINGTDPCSEVVPRECFMFILWHSVDRSNHWVMLFFRFKLKLKGNLAHKFTICYLECISGHLLIDKTFIIEQMCKRKYNPCLEGKANKIWKFSPFEFPN